MSWASHIHPSQNLLPFEFVKSFHVQFWVSDILCTWIEDLIERFWPFEFLERFRCSFSSVSVYHGPQTYTQVKSYGHLNLPRAFIFNFKHLDILCVWIRGMIERLWSFEFLESFHCSFSSVSVYHGPLTYIRVKSYAHLNLARAFLLKFEGLNIWYALITHMSKSFWPFEFALRFHV